MSPSQLQSIGGYDAALCVVDQCQAHSVLLVERHMWCSGSRAVGLNRSLLQAVVQISGDGFRAEVATLQSILQLTPSLQFLLHRYAVIRGLQVAQTAGCNRLHNFEQRLSRWLLMTQDRVDSDVLPITHDFLATMLGTNRSSVSLATGNLQRKKIIKYTHGAVTILNRENLENSACECYGIMQQYNGPLGLK